MNSKDLALFIGQFVQQKKAKDILILDVSKITVLADYFIIATCLSERHTQALVNDIKEDLHKQKIYPLGVEGVESGRWVIADYDDVVLHLYVEEARKFYDLEELWGDATRVTLPSAPTEKMSNRQSLEGGD